jgi:hypothetical protein
VIDRVEAAQDVVGRIAAELAAPARPRPGGRTRT